MRGVTWSITLLLSACFVSVLNSYIVRPEGPTSLSDLHQLEDANDDSLPALHNDIASEKEDDKRYMRFGRAGSDDVEPGEWSDLQRGEDLESLAKRYMRFGRNKANTAPEEMKDAADKRYMRFGKRYMRFGRSIRSRVASHK